MGIVFSSKVESGQPQPTLWSSGTNHSSAKLYTRKSAKFVLVVMLVLFLLFYIVSMLLLIDIAVVCGNHHTPTLMILYLIKNSWRTFSHFKQQGCLIQRLQ